MKLRLIALAVIALAPIALSACGDPTAPGLLLGSWATPLEDIGSGYSRDERLTFRSDGVLEDRMRIYRSGRLEQTSDYSYQYSIRNDSLFTSPRGVITLDRWFGTRFDRGRIVVDGSQLTITYPWFGPADEPVTVTDQFLRMPCRPVGSTCF